MIKDLIYLIGLHAVCDIPLQNPFLSKAKRGEDPHFPQWLALVYHGWMHGIAVLFVTNSVPCAIAEIIIHSVTDYLKCTCRINGKFDQCIHIACKLIYVAVLYLPSVWYIGAPQMSANPKPLMPEPFGSELYDGCVAYSNEVICWNGFSTLNFLGKTEPK